MSICKWCENNIYDDWVRFENKKFHHSCKEEIIRLRKFQSIPKSIDYYGSPRRSAREFRKMMREINND